MAKASQEENAIDLEVSIQQELGKLPSSDADSRCVEMPSAEGLAGPHSSPRCGSSDRELFKNNFTADGPPRK